MSKPNTQKSSLPGPVATGRFVPSGKFVKEETSKLHVSTKPMPSTRTSAKKQPHLTYNVSKTRDGSFLISGTRPRDLVNKYPEVQVMPPKVKPKVNGVVASDLQQLVRKHMKVA